MKVIIGMSGGVDSTIAAYILKKMGHEVIAVYFDFLGVKNDFKDIEEKLGIKIHYEDYIKEFKDKVIRYFVDEYKSGHTPNPCSFCNGAMKFQKLYECMKEYGCDKMATGHYANVSCENGRCFISKSKNQQKDQSYMLYNLSQDILKNLIFPISDMSKEEVRDIAKSLSLDVAEKKDSQDICFIKSIKDSSYDYIEFIKEYDFGKDYKEKILKGELKEEDIRKATYLKKGEFVDKSGKVLGFHDGIINYTIGQRKGLNISFGERKFVIDIDAKNSKVVLGGNEDLQSRDFTIDKVVYQKLDKNSKVFTHKSTLFDKINRLFKCLDILCKVRYRHVEEPCDVEKFGDIIKCKFRKKVRAITKGQAAVFYDKKGNILFGGTIV